MSIYIQLTDKCNMRCDHCCFSCTGKGTFMSKEVFDKCLSLASKYCWDITLGGGEPTLHPKIIEWTMQAALTTVDASIDQDGPATLVITNGKKTDIAIKLAKLAHLGVIAAEVSQDPWHDEIDPRVVQEFSRYNKGEREYGAQRRGYAGIRDVSSGVQNAGRAKKNSLGKNDGDACCCGALFVTPNGDFYHCGCKLTKLGNILTDSVEDHTENLGECEKYLVSHGNKV